MYIINSSTTTQLILLLLASLLTSLTFPLSASPIYTYHACTGTSYYQPNSNFQTTLKTLLSSLINATLQTTFYTSHIPLFNSPNDLKGLFLCRADVTPSICHNCVTAAANNITTLCKNQTESIIWYDQCFLRYSNDSFLNHMVPGITLESDESVPDSESTQFSDFLANFLNGLVYEIVNSPSGQKFAAKEENFSGSMKVYSLAQCTEPDLSTFDCNTCLQGAISSIENCCNGKRGVRSLLPNCNIRYEFYPFYNVSAVSTQPKLTLSSGKSNVPLIIAIVVPIVVVMILFIVGFYFLRKRAIKKYKYNNTFVQGSSSIRREDLTDIDCLQFDFDTIRVATSDFSNSNKLGQGGFGIVYRGKLANGQMIAVKRLSTTSDQGDVEFKNEVLLVAKLQHRNLVRLLGFSLEGRERLLIYEFVPNKSLDFFIFDPTRKARFSWEKRYNIIKGISRGLLYLHEDSRLRIIHRDLKASNILLDDEMSPKISDFGLARLFVIGQTQGNTNRIVGTYGYMAPEYAMHGEFSVKSDVYSFGVLVLEIICGHKNSANIFHGEDMEYLLSYAWRSWTEGRANEIIDPSLNNISQNEIMRCIHIGLLCIQENLIDRPTMASVALMLNSNSLTLSIPSKPAYFIGSGTRRLPDMQLHVDNVGETRLDESLNQVTITDPYPR